MTWVTNFFLLGLAIESVVCSGHSDYVVSTDYTSRYYGPVTVPEVLPDGTLADTPEVSAARAAHLAALQKAQVLWYNGNGYGSYAGSANVVRGESGNGEKANAAVRYSGCYDGSGRGTGGHVGASGWQTRTHYNGSPAWARVLPSGYMPDSRDVAANKINHLGAVTQAYFEGAKRPAKNDGWQK